MEGLAQGLFSLGLRKLPVVSGKLQLNPNTCFDFGNPFQIQAEQKISFLTGNLECTKQDRKLYLSLGLDLFHRLYKYEDYKQRGVYLKGVRRF